MTPAFWRRRLAVLSLMVLGIGSLASTSFAADKMPLYLRAIAVDLSGTSLARTGTLDITIERWSTDQEFAKLQETLIEKGSDALLAAVQKIKPRTGFIRTSTSLGWDLQFAREEPFGDGGRRIIIATDRPMSFWEMVRQPRLSEYDFTLAEIRLTKNGKGVGKLATAAKITWIKDTRTIEIENFSSEPVRLTEVQILGAKKE